MSKSRRSSRFAVVNGFVLIAVISGLVLAVAVGAGEGNAGTNPFAFIGEAGSFFSTSNQPAKTSEPQAVPPCTEILYGIKNGSGTAANNQIYKIDQTTGVTSDSHQVTLAGFTVYNSYGLTARPSDGVLFTILQTQFGVPSVRRLATIDPETGVATDIGSLGDAFISITFRSNGVLYGVTNDDGFQPERLFTINTSTAAPTLAFALGTGGQGETIAFHGNGLMYHSSGDFPALWESIDVDTQDVVLIGQTSDEMFAMSYDSVSGKLYGTDLFDDFFTINIASAARTNLPGDLDENRGLAFTNSCPVPTPTPTPTPGCEAGALDASFGGGDGVVTTPIGTGYDNANAVAVQPDGKIVAVGHASGDFAVLRYNPDGSLDTSFDGDGIVTTAIGPVEGVANAVAIQSDGKIVAAGWGFIGATSDFVVVRYNANGSLDTTFDGDGIVTTQILNTDIGNSVAIQADGKIVVAGESVSGSSWQISVARYNTDGSLDGTFDGDGKLTTAIVGIDDRAKSVAIQPADQLIVVTGESWNGSDFDIGVVRYNTNGTLDGTFNGTGKVTTHILGNDYARSIAIQADGRIVAAGHVADGTITDFALVRYNTNGTLDSAFNGTGKVTTSIGLFDKANTVAIQSDGRIVAAGVTGTSGSTYDFGVVRYNSDGSPDTSFDGDGKVSTPIGSGNDVALAVAIQPNGGIVAAGYIFINASNEDVAIARYRAVEVCPDPPTVTSVNPTSGSTAGGTSVTITGTNFTGATGVTIGGNAATSVVVVDDTSITAVTPAGSAGTASVQVTTPGGTNAANTLYTYADPPIADNEAYSTAYGVTLTRSAADLDDLLDNDDLGSHVATLVSFGGGTLGGLVTANAAGATVALAGGNLTVNVDGSFSLTTPTAPGPHTFQYRLQNSAGFSDATVTINVACPTSPMVVTTNADSGSGSLRQAVIDACPGSTITFDTAGVFATPQTIPLSSGQIVINKNLAIQGPGAGSLNVNNVAGNTRVFYVGAVTASISGITISGGDLEPDAFDNVQENYNGSGIMNYGQLTLNDSIVSNNRGLDRIVPNRGAQGIGIYNGGTLSLNNSVVTNNTNWGPQGYGCGGGIFNRGTANIDRSAISSNTNRVGGICNAGTYTPTLVPSFLQITNSTISGNTGYGLGGGIYSRAGDLTLTNSTISGNTAPEGSGMYIDQFLSNRSTAVTSSTITNNSCAGTCGNASVVYYQLEAPVGAGPFTIGNSIVAGNNANTGDYAFPTLSVDPADYAQLTSQGYNIFGVVDAPYNWTLIGPSDQVGSSALPINPVLGPLANNGGPTMTHSLLAGSPATDKGINSLALGTDQRGSGFPRTVNNPSITNAADGTDIGAFEASLPAPTVTAVNPTSGPTAGGNSVVITGTNFTGATAVSFGGTAAITFNVDSPTQITATTPGHAAGAVSVEVTTPGGTNGANTLYTYVTPCPGTAVVTNIDDSGVGSLRQAVIDACAGGTITFGPTVTGTITLTSGEIVIDKNLTINGPGANILTVSGNNASRIFNMPESIGQIVSISGLTIANGRKVFTTEWDGGGGVFNGGTLTISACTFSNNTITGNGRGGGLFDNNGILTVTGSTFTGNSAYNGGGLWTSHASNITNSTFSGNSAVFGGGGIYFWFFGTLRNSTVTANTAAYGGGVSLGFSNDTTRIFSSIIAGNSATTSSPDFYRNLAWLIESNNVIGITTIPEWPNMPVGLPNANNSYVGTAAAPVNPSLAALAFNGGPTRTHALLPSSIAIDKGSNPLGLTTDQRGAGFDRTINNPYIANATDGDGTDIGAFELNDTTAPDTQIDSTPANPSGPNVGFTFSGTDTGGTGVAGFECRLVPAAFASCTSPQDYTGLSDGSHTFEVRAFDLAGNVDATPASFTWIVDTAPPDTSITANPSDPSEPNVSFSFTGTDAGSGVASFECDLDGGGFAACMSPKSYTGLTQGSHTFRVQAIDNVNNTDPTPASFTWNVDATAPDTSIDTTPANPSNSGNASFTFSGTDTGGSTVASFECSIDGGVFSACTSPQNYTGLSDGSHTFQVRAIDGVGNVDPTPASYTWTIDATAPDTSITANPTNPSGSNVTFSFTGTDTGGSGVASFECQLDGGGFTACTTPQAYNGLADGSHTFQVRAIDNAGNTDASPASFTWIVDTAPPDTSITANPTDPSGVNVSFSFTGTDAGSGVASFECDLDGGGFAACTSPKTYTGLSQGSHTFMVRAIDNVGNVDPSPASFTWNVDATAPDTTINTSPSNPSNSGNASFTFSGTDTGGSTVASFECDLDGGGFTACASPKSYTGLSDGSHTFQVRAIDGVGNVDASPASYTWVVDTTGPDTTITANPTNPSNSSSASFSFTGTDTGGSGIASFECDLDGGGFAACTSPKSYTGLADGSHTFQVRAIDNAGNVDATPAAYTWVIDTAPPDTTINTNPPNPTNSTNASFSFTGTDTGTGVASFECKLDAGAFAACTSPKTYTGLGDGSHTFQVRAIDGIGNVDPTPASYTWTVDTDPPDVTINQAAGQSDPANGMGITIHFTAVFNEPVTGFTSGDVTIGGTAGATTVVVTQIGPMNGTTYDVAVSGMTTGGTVTASIGANKANDAAGNGNTASTSTDNTVTYVPNTPPTANPDSYSTTQDTPLTVPAPGVLGNDSDPDAGNTITAVLVSGPTNAQSFTLNANGSFSYTPNPGFTGTDTFTYKARDNFNADSNTVTVTLNVQYKFSWFSYSGLLFNETALNQVTAGSDVPVRFTLYGNKGNPYSSPPTSQQINCSTQAPIGAATVINRYMPDPYYSSLYDFYQTTWQTQTAWKFTCRRLTLHLNDGTTRSLNFYFK